MPAQWVDVYQQRSSFPTGMVHLLVCCYSMAWGAGFNPGARKFHLPEAENLRQAGSGRTD